MQRDCFSSPLLPSTTQDEGPLLWDVSTGVQEENSLLWHFWNVLHSNCEVKAVCPGVKVSITILLHASIPEDGCYDFSRTVWSERHLSWTSKNLCRKLSPILKAPVPEEAVCTVTYQPLFNTYFYPRLALQMPYKIQPVPQWEGILCPDFLQLSGPLPR